ncbi:vacuolar protein sorting protein DigA [Aspergillus clavatus NRRL 1]|uniref:Vacuolar protein sorting protein DigA n=1 Tax=Aspergillus clavatus (strain ATCC 1007 / CBS 513.65 / DSM 816 / NCTC 3887 / NRRL 1 / QM 1276 / 107) TaxID=344612 RepID=A1C9Y7_ASPCL|nr:vacuolar protein sorting protein DigA [Aspergillus clavatus NRRL 1]EAW12555.1 vacuolar protein sorting protein DigA [Aspergillus clavatus NRRL 1]
MALDPSSSYVAPSNLSEPADASLSMFDVRRVQLQFSLAADFVAAQVANNVLILALSTNRILRIDLDTPEDIDDIDLPKKSSEIGVIRRMFLDPSASHLIITTTLGEAYYLHTQSRQPKPLSRLKNVSIESVAWNPSLPTASTREILLGTTDGQVWETFIEPSTEFYRREEKYANPVYRVAEGTPVTGIWTELLPTKPEQRRVLVATHSKILYFLGKTVRHGSQGVYNELFQRETPSVHEIEKSSSAAPSTLVISSPTGDGHNADGYSEKEFAWLSSQGIYHGQLPYGPEIVSDPFESSTMLSRSIFPATESARGGKKLIQDPITAMTLSQWHILALVEGKVVAVNRMSDEIVYEQAVLEPGQSTLGLLTDSMQRTYWLFTSQEIFEIVAEDEDRDIWKVYLQKQMFDQALVYAHGNAQKDAVATASGDFLAGKGRYLEAAKVWGKSSKGFEEVCLTLINRGEHDALRKYLLAQLATYKRSSSMQRIMVASWLVEVFMSKLNALDDNIATKAELAEGVSTENIQDELSDVRAEFQEFVTKYKTDLDKKTAYDIISSHGREKELLFFATATNDYNYVLSYWIHREKWSEALNVLQKQSDPDVFYKYSSVLMTHAATGLVDILMRQTNLEPERLIPALLNYNKTTNVSLGQNQAVRYLNFIVVNHPKPSAAVHNTLISIHASSPSSSEAGLLTYLQSQPSSPPPYDADFALRLCIQHQRVQSCIHIYSAMGQYLQAVELALQHEDIELAAIVADRPEGNDKLRKKLWLLVAEKKIRQPGTGIKDAIEFLRRCELLRIEDLIPFFPDFVVIDDFKDEICSALEDYSRHIDALRQEMDNSAQTARQIRAEIAALDSRYAIVEPGEKCWLCSLPLLSRQFFVFPCQHAFHSDCLGKEVLEGAGGKRKYIRDLQAQLNKGDISSSRREEIVKELDGLVAEACILCGDHAIKQIDKPFITASEADEWAL